jgi:wyosine [tRNA(Phe)-imidazoG37] synthetase (radical SAM superfamily)
LDSKIIEDDQRKRLETAWRRHERRWADNQYVYAVVSRRSRGVSIGINLNPDKGCNFDCIYCQVDRATPARVRRVDLERLSVELDTVLAAAQDRTLYDAPPFSGLPETQHAVRDIAFSGDGEPTTFPRFADAVEIAARARRRFGLDDTKIVLITDAAYLLKEGVRAGLKLLDANNGEIWAKLDAGTEEYFRLVDRPNVPLQTVLDNIRDTARVRPVVIQTLWLRVNGEAPPDSEIQAYCDRLNEMLEAGSALKTLQLYTIARRPTESYATALTDEDLDRISAFVAARVPVPVETFYGVSA